MTFEVRTGKEINHTLLTMLSTSSLQSLSHLQVLTFAIVTSLLVVIIVGVRRLYFHPLSKFPGPRSAALTSWYGFYFDVIKGGIGIQRWPDLHKNYGSIIRVAPDLIHVDDPEFYREVFSPQTRFHKSEYFYADLGISRALGNLTDPHEHKIRRAIVNPLFSQNSVNAFSNVVRDKLEEAIDVMKKHDLEGTPIDIQKLYRCITADNVASLIFGYSQDLVRLGDSVYPPLFTAMDGFLDSSHLVVHFPILVKLVKNLPPSISRWILPGYVAFREDCSHQIQRIIERRAKGKVSDENGRTLMFDLLLESNGQKGFQRLSREQLIDEALSTVFAGTDTTVVTLAASTFYILRTPGVLAKLREELSRVPGSEEGRFEWKHIQNLPYLAAVVKESLRLHTPVVIALPRVVPPEGIQVQGNFIPGGTIVVNTSVAIHHNPNLFSSPEKYLPERWLGQKGMELEKWQMGFSKGPRQCIGMNIANMEMYLTLANFFGRFEMELFETDEKSMEWVNKGTAQNKSNVKVRAKPLVF